MTAIFARSKIKLTEKLTNGALVSPTLGTNMTHMLIPIYFVPAVVWSESNLGMKMAAEEQK